jgi:4-amino-4-deoxy-L-arabinose transferase-like glycosyltransferase
MTIFQKWRYSPQALWALLGLVYLPFMGLRGLRMAGDEKVYLSQALEMERSGSWFVQTLHDSPDYYKGPFHFVAVRLGFLIFGHSLWAGLYINFLFIMLGTWAIFSIVQSDKNIESAFWAAGLFGLSLGVYAHSFASQMEVELASSFALGLYFLNQTSNRSQSSKASGASKAEFWFWIIAGFVGWIKSPLHSVFLGSAGLLFWLANGEALSRLKSPRSWAALLLGITVGVAGYLPAAIFDYANFLERYLLKETYNKSSSGQGVMVTLTSTFGFYLFPWIFFALSSYFRMFTPQFWRTLSKSHLRIFKLCLSLVAPSVLFFCYHPYRFENYNIPVISGVIVWLGVMSDLPGKAFIALERAGLALLALIFIALAVFVWGLQVFFHPDPSWWPNTLGWSSACGMLGTALCFIRFGVLPKRPQLGPLTYSCLGLYLSIGLISTVLGEREILDLRTTLNQNPTVNISYYNPKKNIWNEWGLLNLVLDRRIQSLHSDQTLSAALREHHMILVPGKDFLEELTQFQKARHPDLTLKALPWKRWRTRGMAQDGRPLWLEAWNTKDLSVLERDFYIVTAH